MFWIDGFLAWFARKGAHTSASLAQGLSNGGIGSGKAWRTVDESCDNGQTQLKAGPE